MRDLCSSAGTYEIGCGYYGKRGAISAIAAIIDAEDIPRICKALQSAPKLRRLLRSLAS